VKTRPKQIGTAWETAVKDRLIAQGYTARRIEEGGRYDVGDVIFVDYYGESWVVECKARANLNVTKTLANAKRKSMQRDDHPHTVVAWKKLTRKDGNERRTPDGEPDVVIMDWDLFMALVGRG
jgi:hypothetical protein